MALSLASPHELPLGELENRCREETRRYRAQEASDERYCLEIFRRALHRSVSQDAGVAVPPVYLDEAARELLVILYTDYVRAQINRAVRNLVQFDDIVQEAWRNFWMAANSSALAFPSLGAALIYLKKATLSAVIRQTRARRGQQREESLQAMAEAAGGEPLLIPASDLFDEHARRRFRERCYDCIADRVSLLIFHLRYGLGYTPREIARWLNENQEGRAVVYTPRQVSNSLERSIAILSGDSEIRDLLQSD